MKNEFNLNIKIVSDGKEAKTCATIEGKAKSVDILGMLAEVIPELLKNNQKAIKFLCFCLENGRSPSKDGFAQTTKIDLSGLRKQGEL